MCVQSLNVLAQNVLFSKKNKRNFEKIIVAFSAPDLLSCTWEFAMEISCQGNLLPWDEKILNDSRLLWVKLRYARIWRWRWNNFQMAIWRSFLRFVDCTCGTKWVSRNESETFSPSTIKRTFSFNRLIKRCVSHKKALKYLESIWVAFRKYMLVPVDKLKKTSEADCRK